MMKLIGVTFMMMLNLMMSAEAYVLSRGLSKSYVKWPGNSPTINFYLNTYNDDGLSDSEVEIITQDSLNQWTEISGLNSLLYNTTSSRADRRNDIVFSNSSTYFNGSGIVGLTLVSFRESDGAILEADILLNEIHDFKDRLELINKLPSDYYLGNVMTHELGHAFGLSHSEVHRSTMFYKLANGQFLISPDDRAGVNHHYQGSTYTGSITGYVFGGSDYIDIFGTQVQAISATTGEIAGAAISDEDGSFIISGLPKNDQYYLYLSPLHVPEAIPSMYADIRKNFCNSNTDYRGSFYSSCYGSDRGFPTAVEISDSNPSYHVGSISIKCGLDMPVRYFHAKGGGTFAPDVVDLQGNAGNAFVGFFSEREIAAGESDNILLDLSTFNVPTNDYYLDVKVIHQNFFSAVKLEMEVTQGLTSNTYPVAGQDGLVYDLEKNAVLDIHQRILLDSANFNNNVFNIELKPSIFKDHWLSAPLPDTTISERQFFQELRTTRDSQSFYFFIVNITKRNPDNSYSIVSSKKYFPSDNKNCPGAPRSYTVKASLYKESISVPEVEQKDDPLGIGCGTIDMDDNDKTGPGMMIFCFMGFLCTLLFARKSEDFIED